MTSVHESLRSLYGRVVVSTGSGDKARVLVVEVHVPPLAPVKAGQRVEVLTRNGDVLIAAHAANPAAEPVDNKQTLYAPDYAGGPLKAEHTAVSERTVTISWAGLGDSVEVLAFRDGEPAKIGYRKLRSLVEVEQTAAAPRAVAGALTQQPEPDWDLTLWLACRKFVSALNRR